MNPKSKEVSFDKMRLEIPIDNLAISELLPIFFITDEYTSRIQARMKYIPYEASVEYTPLPGGTFAVKSTSMIINPDQAPSSLFDNAINTFDDQDSYPYPVKRKTRRGIIDNLSSEIFFGTGIVWLNLRSSDPDTLDIQSISKKRKPNPELISSPTEAYLFNY